MPARRRFPVLPQIRRCHPRIDVSVGRTFLTTRVGNHAHLLSWAGRRLSLDHGQAAALDGWDPNWPFPWPYPLYVAHGVGTELAEPPFAGADFAPEAEAAMVLVEGNVLMIEPYIWEAGVGGYRAEYCAVVGATGTEIVSSLPYGRWPGR